MKYHEISWHIMKYHDIHSTISTSQISKCRSPVLIWKYVNAWPMETEILWTITALSENRIMNAITVNQAFESVCCNVSEQSQVQIQRHVSSSGVATMQESYADILLFPLVLVLLLAPWRWLQGLKLQNFQKSMERAKRSDRPCARSKSNDCCWWLLFAWSWTQISLWLWLNCDLLCWFDHST